MDRHEMREWLRRRETVLARFRDPPAEPAAQRPSPDQEALRIVLQRNAAATGSKDFPDIDGVVFGVRGGMHTGRMRFGEEFHLDGHAWIISSHLEHGERKQTLVVSAVRKDSLRALFDEGVYASPKALRDAAEQARRKGVLNLILTYGLTAEAYGAARELTARGIPPGRVAPADFEVQTAGMLRYAGDLVRCADQWRFSDPLHPNNTTSRAIFARLTGSALPKTLKGTEATLAAEPPPGFERGRLGAQPPCREAVACICVALVRHLSGVFRDDGHSRLKDPYTRRGIAGGVELADAALSSYGTRVGPDADLDLAHSAVLAMREAMAGLEAEDNAPDACDLAHEILSSEADRLRLAVAGHAPAAPVAGH